MASEDFLIRLSVVFKKFGLITNEFLSVICQFLNVGIINLSLDFHISHFGNKAIRKERYIEKGGKLGRKVGSVKMAEQMKAEYREVISLLRKGYSIRDVAKLSGKGVSTIQRVKRLLKVQSPQ